VKLVAKIKKERFPGEFTHPYVGKIFPVAELSYDECVCFVDVTDGESEKAWLPCNFNEVDIYLSSGFPDKNGREILVGDEVTDKYGVRWKVVFDGDDYWGMSVLGMEIERKKLTPELASQMEVIDG
jgi:hypothetical protein